MKNKALYTSGIIFLIVSIAQFLRYKLGIMMIMGNNHHIPIGLSLYISIVVLCVAVWMFIAARMKD